MSKRIRNAGFVLSGLLIAGATVVGSVYLASQRVPDFYEQALEREPTAQQANSDRLLENAAALASNARREGVWSALFTADEINGWLAVELVKKHPDLLPPGVSDPRVHFAPRDVTIAWVQRSAGISTVVTLELQAMLTEPNVVALRIRGAHAGAIPLPLNEALDSVRDAAAQMNLHVTWRQVDGDPVALVTIPTLFDGDETEYHLESLELREGALYVAGRTSQRSESEGDSTVEPMPPVVAELLDEKTNRQR